MKIYQVTGVVVYRVSDRPLTLSIHATGLAATSGWSNSNLDNSQDPNPGDDVHEFSFEAAKPNGIALEVLTPISATLDFKPNAGAAAIVVSSRTNSITVHASEFIDGSRAGNAFAANLTTLAIGEETPPKWPTVRYPFGEHVPTTFALGEEGIRPLPTSPLTDDPFPPIRPFDPGHDPYGPLRGIFGGY